MEYNKQTLLHKAVLLGRGVLVFAILLAVVAGVFWGGYHRYPNVAEWAGDVDDPMSRVRLLENDTIYVRISMSSDSEEDEESEDIIKYTVEDILGEVKPVFPTDWNTNYVVEKIKDQEDLIYITIDDEQVLYCAENTKNPLLQQLLET